MIRRIRNFSVFESISTAWHAVKGSKGAFWAILFAFVLAFFIEKFVILFDFLLIVIPIVIAFQVFRYILFWGMVYFGIQRAFGKAIQYTLISNVFKFDVIANLLGLLILRVLIIAVPIIIFVILPAIFLCNGNSDVFSHGSLSCLLKVLLYAVGAVVTIFLMMRLYISNAIVLDKKVNPFVAVKLSFQATKSRVWQLIGLTIMNMLILVISVIPCGVGLIWSLPYIFINNGVVYKKLVK